MSHRKLYDDLGVDQKSNSDEIKKAYRRKAKKSHPDSGGSEEDFNKLNKAYMILINPETRSKYDATGDESLKQPDNEQSKVMMIIAGALEQVITKFETRGRDPLEVDLVSEMKSLLKTEISKIEVNIQSCNTLVAKTKKMLGKFKVKNGNNFIEQMLLSKISNIGLHIRTSQDNMVPLKKAYDMLDDVSFSFTPKTHDYGNIQNEMMRNLGANIFSGM